MRKDWDTQGSGQYQSFFSLVFSIVVNNILAAAQASGDCDAVYVSVCDTGMLCGTRNSKKKKKKLMYLTAKNAGVYSVGTAREGFTSEEHLNLPVF